MHIGRSAESPEHDCICSAIPGFAALIYLRQLEKILQSRETQRAIAADLPEYTLCSHALRAMHGCFRARMRFGVRARASYFRMLAFLHESDPAPISLASSAELRNFAENFRFRARNAFRQYGAREPALALALIFEVSFARDCRWRLRQQCLPCVRNSGISASPPGR